MKFLIQSKKIFHLGVKGRGLLYRNCPHPQLISRGVVMDMPDGFQSQPCTSIHHTYNDTLEWLGCCEMPESAKAGLKISKWGLSNTYKYKYK